jgi:hypothetical protein
MNRNVDLNRILRACEISGLCEVQETIGEWSFAIDDLPVKLRIKVVFTMPHGKYKAIPNLKIQNPEQPNPCTSIGVANTVEEALHEALRGFLLCWIPQKYRDKTRFEPVEDW